MRAFSNYLLTCLLFVLFFTWNDLNAMEFFKEASFTQVVNDVKVVDVKTKTDHVATQNSIVDAPDVVETGPQSRAELKFADDTVTRIGSNTTFSMDPTTRGINLRSGSILFHSPTGKGGGTIQTAAATAAVTGTTIIVSATSNGGFKVMVLEGKCNIHPLHGGRSFDIHAGQLTFMMPGQRQPTPPIEFHLDEAVGGSNLVQGFSTPLSSTGKIEASIQTQQSDIQSGKAEVTNILVGDAKTNNSFQELVDPSILANTNSVNFADLLSVLEILNQLQTDVSIGSASDFNTYVLRVKFANLLTALNRNGDSTTFSGDTIVAGILGNNITISSNVLDFAKVADLAAVGFIAGGQLTLPDNLTLSNPPLDTVHFEGYTLSLHPNPLNTTVGVYNIPGGTQTIDFSGNNLANGQINYTTFNFYDNTINFNFKGANAISYNNLTFHANGVQTSYLNFEDNSSSTTFDTDTFTLGHATTTLNLNVNAYNGNATLNDCNFNSAGLGTLNLNFYANNNLTMDWTSSVPAFNVRTVNITAENMIDINPTASSVLNINSSSTVRMTANNIRLSDVSFQVNTQASFYTSTGNWYTSTGGGSGLHLVNCTYASLPIQVGYNGLTSSSGSSGQIGTTTLYSYQR